MAPPLLLLHGLGADAGVWAGLMDPIAPTLALDLPGYGTSPRLPQPSIAAFAEAILARLAREQAGPVVAVGHSLGGMVALEMALLRPQALAGLVLVAAPAAFGSRDGRFQERFVAERLAPLEAGCSLAELAPEAVPALCGPEPDPEGLERCIAAMARVPEAGFRDGLRALVGFDRRRELAAVRCPSLVVAGPHDRQVPVRTLRRMAERLPQAVFALVEGAGHLVPFERPRAFAALMRRFLEESGLEGR